MTAINVSATIAQTLTPTGPSEIKICSIIDTGTDHTLNLGPATDGKTWAYVGGSSASGTAILATVSGNTATIVAPSLVTASEKVHLHFVRY